MLWISSCDFVVQGMDGNGDGGGDIEIEGKVTFLKPFKINFDLHIIF